MRFAYDVKRGHGIDGRHDGIVINNLLASYAHLRSAGSCDWAARFVEFRAPSRAGAHCGADAVKHSALR